MYVLIGIQRVAEQLSDTDALLNKYINILGKSEAVTRLIFDERWEGAEHVRSAIDLCRVEAYTSLQDEDVIEREMLEARERERREATERAAAAQREKEQLEREERIAREREEKERIQQERGARGAARGTVRGVRGTRASMRGVRGTTATSTRGGKRLSKTAEPVAHSSQLLILQRLHQRAP